MFRERWRRKRITGYVAFYRQNGGGWHGVWPRRGVSKKKRNQCQRRRKIEGKRKGAMFWKQALNRGTFTVTQRRKWSLFEDVFNQKHRAHKPAIFSILLLKDFLCSGWSVWGFVAEAIWVSSTSKVGQLVPVPLLMCWRGALSGGSRAQRASVLCREEGFSYWRAKLVKGKKQKQPIPSLLHKPWL